MSSIKKHKLTPEQIAQVQNYPMPQEFVQILQATQSAYFAETGVLYSKTMVGVETIIKSLIVQIEGLTKELEALRVKSEPAPNRAERRRAEKKVKKDKVKIVEKTTNPQIK